jgi:phage shock protein A
MLFVHIRGLAALAIAECMELECAEAESLVISPRTLVGIVRKRIGLMRFASYLDDVRASAYFAAAITGSPGLLLEQRFARGVLTTEFRQGSGLVEELGHMYIVPQELVSIMEPVYDCVQKRLLHEYVEQEVPPSDTEMQGSTLKSAEVGVSASPRNAKEFATPGSLSIDNRHFDDTTNKSSNEIRAMQMRIRELEDMVAQLDEYKRMIRKQDEALLASKEEVEMLRTSLRESQDYADSLLRGSESRFREELRLVRDQLTEREDLVRRLTEQVASLEQALQSRQRDVESISKACEALALENEQLRNAGAHVDDGSSVLPAQHVHSGVFRDPAERTTADHFRSNEAHAYIDETSESSACDITDVRILERALAEERQKNERLMILLNQFEDAERGEDSASELVRIENAHLRERLRALEDYIQSQNRTNTGADGAPSKVPLKTLAAAAPQVRAILRVRHRLCVLRARIDSLPYCEQMHRSTLLSTQAPESNVSRTSKPNLFHCRKCWNDPKKMPMKHSKSLKNRLFDLNRNVIRCARNWRRCVQRQSG